MSVPIVLHTAAREEDNAQLLAEILVGHQTRTMPCACHIRLIMAHQFRARHLVRLVRRRDAYVINKDIRRSELLFHPSESGVQCLRPFRIRFVYKGFNAFAANSR